MTTQRILVWDIPTRLFHWLLAGSFAGAYLTSESERLAAIHVGCGYALLGLIGFRLIYGLIGSRYARFSEFVRGPGAVIDYLRSLLSGNPQRFVGHNPAGAVAIMLLLVLGLATGASGFAMYNELGGEWLEDVHEACANAMLAVVILHVLGVIASSVLHKENLARAMVTGRKEGSADEGIERSHGFFALLLAAAVAALGWSSTQSTGPVAGSIEKKHGKHERGHDHD
ncbi:cytochrome b/b6 domain-containing protein [Sulfurisoma sediminicola]|uniref:Cytochrome b n=1 Tax=Sulfurisoma sediminicola TaxID=1381557 RepID=A0A497XJG9_9PROT|nr:cytochrome b/b6 domain-containing protein [Sulfurisoma sediminicola]RLJ67525.1 cytochrome b [Sulfurisoma sediminicola]